MESEEVGAFFKKAIMNKQIVIEDIIYKNGKYYKQNPLLGT